MGAAGLCVAIGILYNYTIRPVARAVHRVARGLRVIGEQWADIGEHSASIGAINIRLDHIETKALAGLQAAVVQVELKHAQTQQLVLEQGQETRVLIGAIDEQIRPTNGDQRSISDRLDEVKVGVRKAEHDVSDLNQRVSAVEALNIKHALPPRRRGSEGFRDE
jgi:hypothetical protein